MANVLILSPMTIAAIAASRGSGAANLITPSPREVWADSAVGSAANIDIDLGSARSIDTVFFGSIRPPAAGATWTITGGAAGYAETVLKASGALRAIDSATGSPDLTHAFWKGGATSVRYLRLAITQPAGSSPLTVGNVMVGKAWQPEFNMEFGAGRRIIDTGTVAQLPDGGFATVEGVRKRAFGWTLGDLSSAEVDALEELLLAHGETIPLLVAEDPAASVGQANRIHYGLFTALRAFERRNARQTRWEFGFEEWSAGNAAAAVTPPPASPPSWSIQPSISGTAQTGQTLTGSDGTIVNGTVSGRQWLRNGSAISGATGSTYVLVLADEGANITFRVTATGSGGSSQATSSAVGPVVPAAPALPALAQIVGHFNSSAITPQTDNTNLTQWDDSSGSGAHATQATSTKQPKYRAAGGAGINGLPYVSFDGVDDVLSIVTPGALKTAIDGLDYTIMVVVDNVTAGSGGFGCVFGTGVGGDSLHVMASAGAVGNSGAKLSQVSVSGTGYRSFGVGSTDTSTFGGSGGANLRRYFFRGTIPSSYAEAGKGTGGKTLAIGGGNVDAAATFFFKGNIYRIVIWSKLLTPAEAMQAEIYFNWFYNQTHPAVTLGKFLHIDGDSRYVGVGADIGASGWNVAGTAAAKTATGLSYPPGTYSNYAVGGLTIQKCIDKGGEIDTAAAVLAAAHPAVAHRLMYEAFFNSRALSVGTIATAGTLAYQTKQYVDARRAGLPAGTIIVGASPFDHADVNNGGGLPDGSGSAGPWGQWLGAGNPGGGSNNWSSLGFDGFADIWANATLGGNSANPAGDGVHLSEANQTVQSSVLVAAYSAISGF